MADNRKTKLKNLLLYAGLTGDEYEEIWELYYRNNSGILRIITLGCGILTTAFGIYEHFAYPNETSYISFVLIGLVNLVLASLLWGKARGNVRAEKYVANAFMMSFYFLGIYVGTIGIPDKLAVLYMVVIVAMPMVINDRPITLLSEMICSVVVFSLLALKFKPLALAYTDIVDTIVFATISIVLNIYLYVIRAKGCLAEINSNKTNALLLQKNTELEEKQEELEKALVAADAANKAKSTFLFNMSHDIRTPMNASIGFRDLLEKHQDDPVKRQDYLRKINDANQMLLSIINNVLEMARIESGMINIEEAAYSSEQFNDALNSIFEEMMSQKDITFTRSIDIEHHYVYCDPIKLREIFVNILSNAYKYTNPGGSVHMELKEIPCDREGWVLFRTTISDTGIGMDEDFIPHVFEAFTRESNTTDTKIEGTGLGMSIVKHLVDLMGGTIEVKSKKGEGSAFIVTMPHRIAKKEDLVSHERIDNASGQFDGKRILLAEDNELNAEIAVEILKDAGFMIEHAPDGRVCVDMLREREAGYYDLILMDIQMPNMNGYEATRTIRALEDKDKAGIKIIAMTANAFEEDKREAFEAGMNGHVAKPIDIAKLMSVLAEVLNTPN
ncbi:MAG: ATP-binding protein [Eubacteriales bacterium]|nr:ATP-binding protein [Eubacteriales bacterium]